MSKIHDSRITELALKSIENRITPEEFAELDSYIAASKENACFFTDCLATYMAISDYHEAGNCKVSCFSDSSFDPALWHMLSEAEVTAPAIRFDKEPPERPLVQKVVYEKVPERVNRISLMIVIFSAAAMLFLLAVIRVVDFGKGPEAATIVDSINGKLANAAEPILTGTRLTVGRKPLFLQEGIAELLFDNGARIVIEAPAEFQILADDRVGLNCGKVYAIVPHKAIGFSIYTSNAKVIDLGTEFGVNVDCRGDTYLYTIKGQTRLLTGGKSEPVSRDIFEGSAKKISADLQTVTDVPCDTTFFIRKIDSKSDFIWKGQSVNLADIVSGGNGFGTGQIEMTIDPSSGNLTKDVPGRRESANDYRPVPSSPYVDGVFVPNGRKQQVVSSEGHQFQECPVTSGLCCFNISCGKNPLDLQAAQNSTPSVSTAGHTLAIHANMGITFDLEAIRGLTPGLKIVRFQSTLGIRKWNPQPDASNADFWILVDGELRYRKEQVKTGELHSVDIELSDNDRFLTLVETDGGDPENRTLDGLDLPAIHSDWGMFADPRLVLE